MVDEPQHARNGAAYIFYLCIRCSSSLRIRAAPRFVPSGIKDDVLAPSISFFATSSVGGGKLKYFRKGRDLPDLLYAKLYKFRYVRSILLPGT